MIFTNIILNNMFCSIDFFYKLNIIILLNKKGGMYECNYCHCDMPVYHSFNRYTEQLHSTCGSA